MGVVCMGLFPRLSLRGTDWKAFSLFLAIMVFFSVFLFLPILYVFRGALFVEGQFTLLYFNLMFQDAFYTESILNSIQIGVFVTLLTSAIGIPLAFLMVRYDFPGKRVLQVLILVPLVMPPFVGAIGMKQLFARYGSVNLLLMQLNLIKEPIDWFGGGFIGIIVLEALHLYPFLYLNIAAALANIDPTLEEQAENLGASGFRLFRTVTFPLMFPGYVAGSLIVFIWAFTDLGTPLIFEYRRVVPPIIFSMVKDIWTNPMGYALTVLTLVISVLLVVAVRRYGGGKSYEMLGRGHIVPRVRRIKGWKIPVVYLFVVFMVLAAMIPQISVILTSVADEWFFTVLPTVYSLKYYEIALTHRVTAISILNSLKYSVFSTGIDVLLGIVIGYLLARRKFPGKDILDSVAMLPLAIPGIVIAFGYVSVFTGTPLDPFFDPTILLILSYSVRRLPYTVRAAYAGFQQTSVSLEEASLSVGASPLRTLISITTPLIMANVLAGGIMSFSAAMMEVSDSMILANREGFYPITKAIYSVNLRLGDGPFVASSLGMIGTFIVMACLLAVNKILGKSMGELFRA
ncbi:MAG: iron ABC transporter permease [Candidatus Bathyarchaeota archaeon]|nr:iron ABC transporter permease [Candidatus Bathyarchaeota archaeon]